MLLPNFNVFLYSAPEEKVGGGGGAIENKNLGVSGMVSLMEEDDKEEPIKLVEDKEEKKEEEPIKLVEEEKEEGEEETEGEDELKELEDELKEPDEDKLELITPARRKDILKEFPDVFKKFPYLEHAYYRDQQFSEMFATPKEAKDTIDKAQILDQFDSDLKQGNIETALKAVKGSGEIAFNKLVDDYLPNLARIDKDAYHHVIGNILKTTAIQMIEDGRSSGNEELLDAAKVMYKFIFPSDKQIMRPSVMSKPEDNKEEDRISEREQAINKREFERARDELTVRVTNTLKSTIEANIDPKGSMTDYVKKNASRDCYEKLESLLNSDKRLGVLIDRLWESAFKENFSKSAMDKIKTAYNSRAKSLLPTVIKQARQEALKSSGKREESTDRKGPIAVGKSASSSQNSGKSSEQKAKEIPADVSSRDYLMSDS